MTSTASQPNQNPAPSTTTAAAPSYASAAGANKKQATTTPHNATGSNPPVVVGSAPPAANGKPQVVSSMNGRPNITPAVPVATPSVPRGPPIANGTPADHARRSSVTINAPSSHIGGSGPVPSSRLPKLGFDSPGPSHSSPAMAGASPMPIPGANLRIQSPAQSPSPIPQAPQQSGGQRAPQNTQAAPLFGSFPGDGDRHMKQAMGQGSHGRRDSNNHPEGFTRGQGFGGGGRGRGSFGQHNHQNPSGYPPAPNNYPGQNTGRARNFQPAPINRYQSSPNPARASPAGTPVLQQATLGTPTVPPFFPQGMAAPYQPQMHPVKSPFMPNEPIPSSSTFKQHKNKKGPRRDSDKGPQNIRGGPFKPQAAEFTSRPRRHSKRWDPTVAEYKRDFNSGTQPLEYPNSQQPGYHFSPGRGAAMLAPPYHMGSIDLSPEGGVFEQLLTANNPQINPGYMVDPTYRNPAPFYHGMPAYGMANQMPPGSQFPHQGYVPQYGQPQPQPAAPAMSRNASQVSNNAAPTGNQAQTPAAAQGTPQQRPSQPAVVSSTFSRPPPTKIMIKDPASGNLINFPPKQPGSPAAGIQHSRTPPAIVSTATPPPKPAAASHSRNDSTVNNTKTKEQIQKEFLEKVQQQKDASAPADSTKEDEAKLAAEKKKAEDEAKEKAEAEAKAKEAEKAAAEKAAAEKAAEEERLAAEKKAAVEKAAAEKAAAEKAAAEKAAEEERLAAEKAAAEKAEAEAKAKADAEADAEAAKKEEAPQETEDEELERMIREMEEEDLRREKEQEEISARKAAEKAAAKAKADADKNKDAATRDKELREQEREMERLEEERERKRKEGQTGPSLAEALSKPLSELKISDSTEKASAVSDAPAPAAKTGSSDKQRGKPAALNLAPLKTTPVEAPQPSAALQSLRSARFLHGVEYNIYPEGIMSPNPSLNSAVQKRGKVFKYDSQFLLQFKQVFTEQPSLEFHQQVKTLIGDSDGSRSASARTPGGRSGSSRGASAAFPSSGAGPMGQFGATKPLPAGTTSEQRFAMSQQATAGRGGMGSMGGFNRPGTSFAGNMSRNPSSAGGLPSPRTGSRRGAGGSKRGGDFGNAKTDAQAARTMPLTAGQEVKPIEVSKNGWKPTSIGNKNVQNPVVVVSAGGHLDPDMVQRKVKAALNKMTPEKFDKIADQILAIASQSKNETDGRTLRQVIQLTFEKATDEAHWASMYAKFCKRMLETMSPEIRDENITDKTGAVVSGGPLFRKYLLNRCQTEFERGWKVDLPPVPEETKDPKTGEAAMLSDEYYIAAAAKRRGLGLVQFIGELYKLGMLTERIMHECVHKLLEFKDMPDEAEVESLTKLLRTIGGHLDSTEKGRPMMDIYFARIESIINLPAMPSRLKFMLMDIVDLRRCGWQSKDQNKGPKTLDEVRAEAEAAAAQKAAENARGNQRGAPGGRPMGGRQDSRNFSYANTAPNTVASDDLRRLKGSSSRNSSQSMSFGPTSMFQSRSNSGRRPMGGPGGAFGRQGGDDSPSRGATPVAHANAFGLLADSGDHPGSPPSASASPALSKATLNEVAAGDDKKE
ncbi:hypothetical protein QBC38DRAFT_444954 [Podospora fimiseda]|uniref:MIF4G domain-containing protein n=1 Tax=Podospora fimiseda TaxID=252190 RepID=A0AAN7BMI8_9PEZI|nr:hypothetical protein QBC38DRAFT_444954 [Podospora fimiseda]